MIIPMESGTGWGSETIKGAIIQQIEESLQIDVEFALMQDDERYQI